MGSIFKIRFNYISFLFWIITLIIFSSFASAQKFDYLKFRDADYVSSCGSNTKCRMCFDVVKSTTFSVSQLNWKTHITDVNTKTKDYSAKVSGLTIFRVATSEVNEIIGYQKINIEKNYTCNYLLNFTANYAWCYEPYIEAVNLTSKTRIHYEHSFSRKNDLANTIFWNEEIDDTTNPITRKVNKTEEIKSYETGISNYIKNAPLGTNTTICLEGNVNLGEKVDIYPEIFGYNYSEYAIWDGNKFSLLYSNWSEWKNISRFNLTIWIPYVDSKADNITLDYIYVSGFNQTLVNGTDIYPDGASQTIAVGTAYSVFNLTNDFGARRTATASELVNIRYPDLDYTKNYTAMIDIYSVATSTNVVYGIHRASVCTFTTSVFTLYFSNGVIQQAKDLCGASTLHDLTTFRDGRWYHVELRKLNMSSGTMDFWINGTLYNQSLTSTGISADVNNLRLGSDGGANLHSYFDNFRICEENNNGECSFQTYGILTSKKVTFNTTFNQANCTFYAITPTGTSIKVNVSADNGTSWTNCNNNAITSLGQTTDSLIVKVELNGTTISRPMANYALNLTVSNSAGGGGEFATETQGDDAIERAINSSLTTPSKYSNQQVYLRYVDGTQNLSRFDWFVVQTSPQKRWAINYVTINDPTSGIVKGKNVSSTFYMYELQNLTEAQITDTVGNMLNATKN